MTKYFGQSSVFSVQKDTSKSLTLGIFAISFLTLIKCSKPMITPIASKSWSPTVFVATIMLRILISAYWDIVKTAKTYNLTMRSAAFVFAISKAIDVAYKRGIFP